jgi:competence protein ComEC
VRRPSIAVLVVFWSGLVTAGGMPLAPWLLVGTVAALAVLMSAVRSGRIAPALFLGAVFLLGVLRSPEAGWKSGGSVSGNRVHEFPCVVTVAKSSLLPVWGEPARVRVEKVAVGYAWLEGKQVYLRGPNLADVFADGRAIAVGTFHPPRPRLNPYGWDPARRYMRDGVVGTVQADCFPDAEGKRCRLSDFRNRIQHLISSAGSDRGSGVLRALLLGERTDLSPRVKDVMLRGGTYHVLAISGLHVGIVVLLVTSLVTATGPPRAMRILLAAVCVLGYVVFTGARPSAQRAGTFFALVSLARYLQWRVDFPNLVCAAGTVLLVACPHLAWDIGFKLSIAAVFGITLLVPELQAPARRERGRAARLRRYISAGMLASFSAQVATLPILLYHFGRVSLMGVLLNLLVLPLVTLAVAAGLEASVAGLLWQRLGLIFMRSAGALVSLMIALTSLATSWVDPVLFPGRPDILQVLTYVSGVCYIALLRPNMKRWWKMAGLVLLFAYLVSPGPRTGDGRLSLTFIHVGDGDAGLIEFPDGTTMLIDTGTGAGAGEYDAGRLDVLPLLAMRGIKRVDTVIITHSHSDHYGGLGSLIGNVAIGRVLVGTFEGERRYSDILDECRARGIELGTVGRGDTLGCGGAFLEVLHPSPAYVLGSVDDPNAQSIVLMLTYGGFRALFTGDVTPAVQSELADSGLNLACDVLKVPHHGAPGGVDPAFAAACEAKVGVISVGTRFASHPSPETIDLLEAGGTVVLTTLHDGAVIVTTDGKNIMIRTEVLGPLAHLLDAERASW